MNFETVSQGYYFVSMTISMENSKRPVSIEEMFEWIQRLYSFLGSFERVAAERERAERAERERAFETDLIIIAITLGITCMGLIMFNLCLENDKWLKD
jgi:hypothetical protein